MDISLVVGFSVHEKQGSTTYHISSNSPTADATRHLFNHQSVLFIKLLLLADQKGSRIIKCVVTFLQP